MKVRNLGSLLALRYLVFCNVLHNICNVRAIPRVYRLYDARVLSVLNMVHCMLVSVLVMLYHIRSIIVGIK